MAGFALLFNQQNPITVPDTDFTRFANNVAAYKCLEPPKNPAVTGHCIAAKLDSNSSLHRGIAIDKATGSWLLAAGTVIDRANTHPDGDLMPLLGDYLEQGHNVLDRLDGQFALVIYDARREQANVISDPFGLVGVFYAQAGNQILVSTSALAIAKAIGAKPDEYSIRTFILYGKTLRYKTLWQDVYQIPAGTVLQLSRAGIKQNRYWTFTFDEPVSRLPLSESVDYAINLLSTTIRRGLSREKTVWLSLTGGLDSRTLAALMNFAGLSFKSYCHGPTDSKDVRIASMVSQTMGWDHEYFAIAPDWGRQRAQWLNRTIGHSDARLGVLKTSRIIREQTLKARQYPVSLWGYGGEIYRGFYWKQEPFRMGANGRVDYDRLLDYRIMPVTYPLLKNNDHWTNLIRDDLKNQLKTVGEQNPGWPKSVKLDLIGAHLESFLSGATISAVMGLQRVISPFDMKQNMAGIISVNYKWRLHSRLFRLILEQVNPSLAALETADGGPASAMRPTNFYRFIPYWLRLSERIIWGASHKFLGRTFWRKINPGTEGQAYPLAQWRRETLAELENRELLLPAKMYTAGLYNPDRLEALIGRAKQDDFNLATLLSRILTIEMALRLAESTL